MLKAVGNLKQKTFWMVKKTKNNLDGLPYLKAKWTKLAKCAKMT